MPEKKQPSCEATLSAGRFAAGEDPAKRDQILEGAKRVFMTVGFDAASMNDITREAGVSKGTIYVYFENKDDLFAALMERERLRLGQSMQNILADIQSAEEGLRRYGIDFALQVTKQETIFAMRTMVAVATRMPKLSGRFFHDDTLNVRNVLERFLERQMASGNLRIDDVKLAARQYIDLTTGSFLKMRLFGDMPTPPPRAEIESVVESGLKVFLAAYGPAPK
ncbi:TetR/AcrR family transcriptional regulator [Rhizobium sp. FY34]|uniref:TetR/AcrR family transcriptional regulator n=1 Tax=Rhizobium sp. FY34 TaxID=2562309 RepID=UPI0010C05486|nr:TetR/AcrR family transcriptional regulator [Rhizobium sp. FY34]